MMHLCYVFICKDKLQDYLCFSITRNVVGSQSFQLLVVLCFLIALISNTNIIWYIVTIVSGLTTCALEVYSACFFLRHIPLFSSCQVLFNRYEHSLPLLVHLLQNVHRITCSTCRFATVSEYKCFTSFRCYILLHL